MISRVEITKNKDVPLELEQNLRTLLERVNKLRNAWGKSMIVTSGLRSKEDQVRIYHSKGIFDEALMHMKSKHFSCQAVDFADPDGSLKKFVKADDYAVLKECQLWMEDEGSTKGWLHVQVVPPKSELREFKP